jgi:hypothetical protein
MDDSTDRAEAGTETARRTPPRKADPLSQATRRRLLHRLLAAADAGDATATGVLLELSFAAERDAAVAEALAHLKAGDTEGAS